MSGFHIMGLVLSFTTICFSQASNFTDLLLYLHTSSFQISIGNILESSYWTQHNNLWNFTSTQKKRRIHDSTTFISLSDFGLTTCEIFAKHRFTEPDFNLFIS